MQITLFSNFEKRYNSTKRPSTVGDTVDVKIKDGTSIDKPTFVLASNNYSYNYVKAFGRYYFVDDVKSIHNGLIELSCHVDVLATYRDDIKLEALYAVRCGDPNKADYTIIDSKYPISMVPMIEVTKETAPAIFDTFTDGYGITWKPETVILTIKGAGGSQYVAMLYSALEETGLSLYDLQLNDQDKIYQNIGNLPSGFEKTFLDPFSYICEARILPIQSKLLSGNPSPTLKLGFWDYTEPAQVNIYTYLTDRKLYTDYVSIQPEPITYDSKLWLASNRFRKLSLTLPGVGTVQLDADKVLDSAIGVWITIDVTGCVAYRVEYNGCVDFYTGKIGCNIALHYNSANVGYTVGSASNIIGDILGGAGAGAGAGALFGGAGSIVGGIAGAVGGAIKGISSSLSNAQPLMITRTNGADGSLADFLMNNKIVLQDVRYDIGGTLAPGQNGYPCSQPIILSTVVNNTYVQCENASVPISGTDTEKVELNNLLNSGFYWQYEGLTP